jgi:hypothetical protein
MNAHVATTPSITAKCHDIQEYNMNSHKYRIIRHCSWHMYNDPK